MAEIMYIKTSEIYPHPKNPRKDLGDVSELAESIKHSGILQNLTVVKGHYRTKEEFSALSAEYSKNPTEELRAGLNEKKSPEGYTVIIGHRRLAASKMAELSEVPCTVSNMDEKEQLATMITENMQRTDLTVYEQAQGFQTMLDLGETEDTISERTGFSKGTVRHRLNLAKLDQELLKKKEKSADFQLTLKDLYELEKLDNEKDRNAVLKEARSSREIGSEVERFLKNKLRKENEKKLRRLLKENGIAEAPNNIYSYSRGYENVMSVSLDNASAVKAILNQMKKLKDKGKCLFKFQYDWLYILKRQDKKKKELSPYELEQKEKDSKRKYLRSTAKEVMSTFTAFVRERIKKDPSGENPEVFRKLWVQALRTELFGYESKILSFISEKQAYEMSGAEKESARAEADKLSTLNQLLILIAGDDRFSEVCSYNLEPKEENIGMLSLLYDTFFPEGFVLTDGQIDVIKGTHEYYAKGDKR